MTMTTFLLTVWFSARQVFAAVVVAAVCVYGGHMVLRLYDHLFKDD